MAVSVSNLTMGPATLYSGVVGAVEPADASINTAPAASAWTDLGGTMDGIQLTVAKTYKELEVDQVVDIPGRRVTKRETSIKTNLAEPTLQNLAVALNESAPVTGAAFDYLEPDNTSSAVNPNYSAFLLDGIAPGGNGAFRRRVVVRRGLSVEDVQAAYKKDGQTVIPVTISAHYVSPSIKPYRVVDQKS